ncbi:alpha/beta fold hydrolase [Rufibacter ruber]|uniref:alpha/beta fold hydrolase n=1 Tax=Rufibacter ruber TaxID=1783499 RepID=UPI000832F358|nr:alpha/beta hydrolase [Rufibacter ruber]
MKHSFYTVNHVQLNVWEAGNPADPAILFLHGFPEFGKGWHRQLQYFSTRGWHAVAPDQRGYHLSSKPTEAGAYTTDLLTKDIADLIPQISRGTVVLVGHDWGGAVAWNLALTHPHLLEKLVVLNMPHPQTMHHHLTHNPQQMLRSWYTGFFQLTWLPEQVNRAFDFKFLESALTGTALPGTFPPEVLQEYKQAWAQPGAIEAMLNWYRAYKHNPMQANHTITTPTLLLWGKKDKFLGTEMAQPSMAHCQNGQLVFLENATHWLHHEQPEQVSQLITAFIRH